MYIQKGTTEYMRASLALFIGGFVTFAILYTTQPLLPIFAKEFNVSAPIASLTLSISTGMLAVVMLIAPAISDVIGKKRIMVFSMFFTSIFCVLTALSSSFTILILLRALLGVFIAGVPSIAMAYVSEEFNPKGIGKIMGLYISGTSIGGMAGRMITGALTDLFTWRIALISIGALTLVMSLVFLATLPTPNNSVKEKVSWSSAWRAYKAHFTNRKIMVLIILAFLLMGSFVSLYNYMGFLLMEPPYNLSQTVVGFLFTVYICGTFSSVYMGKKADKWGTSLTLKVSILIMLSGAILTLVPLLIGKLIGISIFTFGFFASHSIASAWVGDSAEKFKAQASSLYLLFYYLGSSLVGLYSGYFWVKYHWLGVISLIILLLSVGYSLVLFAQRGERMSRIYQGEKELYKKHS